MKCAACTIEFTPNPTRTKQRFCSERCRRRRLAQPWDPEIKCANCGEKFHNNRPGTRFCSNKCRYAGYNSSKPKQHKIRLRCFICGGRHLSSTCSRPSPSVKQFGTVVDGKYVAPEGVTVRRFDLPIAMFGDQFTKILNARRKP